MADTQRSGRCERKLVEVQVLSSAPMRIFDSYWGIAQGGAGRLERCEGLFEFESKRNQKKTKKFGFSYSLFRFKKFEMSYGFT